MLLPARGEELEITATASTNPVSLQVRVAGVGSGAGTMILYRREASGGYSPWTEITTNLYAPASVGVWTDATVTAGTVYEYRADRSDFSGTGYGVAGIDIPPADARGRLLLIAEDTLSAPLAHELGQLEIDLTGDGWHVLRATGPRHDPSLTQPARLAQLQTVRNVISNAYAAAGSLEAVLLVGRLPVPYTHVVQDPFWVGKAIPYPPDGHDNHAGCWPSDAYYADITGGAWTDSTVAWTNNSFPRCSTVPGDGKFDVYRVPSTVELQVGRVDLSDLPAHGTSETELMRRYLNKLHRFRTGQFDFARRAVVTDDHTPVRRSMPAWFGPAGYAITNMLASFPDTNGFYATYANGAGSFTSVGAHYTTTDLVNHDPRVFLQMALGSYFGDWDYTNNLLRANLGGRNGGLASLWVLDFGAGYTLVNINWSLNHMALGQTLGYGVRYTQNRAFEGTTKPSTAYTLMGDPTLRLFPVLRPSSLSASNNGASVELSWTASPSPDLLGYHVYQATNGWTGAFSRITTSAIPGASFTHTNALPGTTIYQVRAVKRETSGAGTYQNTSLGIFALASSDPVAHVSIDKDVDAISETGGIAQLVFTRTGTVEMPLAVAYLVAGAAQSNDFTTGLSGTITIPAGERSASLTVSLADDALLEGRESLVVTLVTNATVQAGLFIQQTLALEDNDSIPATPGNLTAVVDGGAVQLEWTDNATNETRYIIERREVSGGGTLIMDNDNTNHVSLAPPQASWFLQTFTNSFAGNCRAMKQGNTATNYVDFRPKLAASADYDLDLWYPSGSVGGSYVIAQTVTVVHATGAQSLSFAPRTGGGQWQSLGRFTLGTGCVIRLQSASSGSEYSVADAVRITRPFQSWTQLPAQTTGWLDTNVATPASYEYRVFAAIDNATSPPSPVASASLGGSRINQMPFVEAGTNQFGYFPLTNLLAGSASDPDDYPGALTHQWTQAGGPAAAIISNTNAYNTPVTYSTSGVYVFSLRADDGLTTTIDTVTVTVNPPLLPGNSTNQAPFTIDSNTIALWHFDGDGLDASGNGYHLTLSNGITFATSTVATAWMAAPAGAAMQIPNYPHVASYSFPDAALLNTTNRQPLTLEARIFMEAWGSNSVGYKMMGYDQNADTQLILQQVAWDSPFGKITGNSGAQLVSETEMGALLNTGVWHHLMLAFDGSNVCQVILDGVPVGQPVTNAPNWGRSNNILVTLGNFKGYIDEARLSRSLRYEPAPPVDTNPPVASSINGYAGAGPGTPGFNLLFDTVTGQLYRVEYSADLLAPDWLVFSNDIPGTGAPFNLNDQDSATSRYYRIHARRP